MISRYSIKDLERLSGIKAHTLRAWEQRYNIITPKRTETNIRYYKNEDLKKVLNISVLVKNGLRISEIAGMEDDEMSRAVMDVGRYRSSYDSQINTLKIAMLEFDESLFESVFNKCLIQFGTEETFSKILSSFIEQVGLIWQVGAINIGNEHFISNLVKQKLFSAVDHTLLPTSPKCPSYILYLPSDEWHELGLLYLYYYLKVKGCRVIYLGQSVPLDAVKEVSLKTGITNLIGSFTTNPYKTDLRAYVERICDLFSDDEQFYLAGNQWKDFPSENLPVNISLSEKITDLREKFFRAKV